MRKVFVVVLALGALQPGLSSAGAQGTPVPPQTPVEIELLENLSSQTMQAGQSIGFKVVRPVLVNGTTLLEAGAQVTGEVKTVQASRAFAKNGAFDLILRPIRLGNGTLLHLDFYRPKMRSSAKEKTGAAIVMIPVLAYYFPLIPVAVYDAVRRGKPYEIREGERYLVYVISSESPTANSAPEGAPPAPATEPKPAQPSRE